MNRKLFNLSTEIDVAYVDLNEEEEALVKELDEEFKALMSSPFDELIADAVSQRGCVYVELIQTKAN